MRSQARRLMKGVVWVAAAMVVIVVLHLGGPFALRVGQFSPLLGAFIGGTLVLASVFTPISRGEDVEPWTGHEQVAWTLIGFGIILWGLGETVWRYSISIGQAPFPSVADIGYSSFPPLVFIGLLLQPSPGSGSRRILLLMDSLISMGSILAIAWYLLLGSLAQAPGEANLAKFLGLYYPIGDTALLSCVVFLLLRGQRRIDQAAARRTGLLLIGLGLCFFVTSDFIFNIQQNAGTYVEATWIDLGWPLGMMTIGVAACLRRFLPATHTEVGEQGVEGEDKAAGRPPQPGRPQGGAPTMDAFGPTRFVPYALLALLFLALMLNTLATDTAQRAIRPVLLFATMGVVALVVARQLLTLWENARLSAQQAEALKNLRRANARIEEQARQIAAHNAELENGIAHLKEVQAQLANGNLQARAHLTSGALLSLAGSLNIMAERLMRLGQTSMYAQRLIRALGELSVAFDRKAAGAPFILPASCNDFMEINRLLLSMRLRGGAINRAPPNFPTTEPLRQNPALQSSPTQHIPVPMHPLQRPQTPQAASAEQQNLPKTVLGVRPSPAVKNM